MQHIDRCQSTKELAGVYFVPLHTQTDFYATLHVPDRLSWHVILSVILAKQSNNVHSEIEGIVLRNVFKMQHSVSPVRFR